jgi:hypothetical protein
MYLRLGLFDHARAHARLARLIGIDVAGRLANRLRLPLEPRTGRFREPWSAIGPVSAPALYQARFPPPEGSKGPLSRA